MTLAIYDIKLDGHRPRAAKCSVSWPNTVFLTSGTDPLRGQKTIELRKQYIIKLNLTFLSPQTQMEFISYCQKKKKIFCKSSQPAIHQMELKAILAQVAGNVY